MKTLLLLGVSALCASAALGQYTITTLPSCEVYVQSLAGITERGAVAWSCWDGFQAEGFLCNRNGVQSFGGKEPGVEVYLQGINRREEVAGWIQDRSSIRAVVWRNGAAKYLESSGVTFATGINDHSDIVGGIVLPDDEFYETYHPFLYRDGVMHDLGALAYRLSFATAINNKGTILLYLDDGITKIGFYEKGGLRLATPFDNAQAIGEAINERGNVAGSYIGIDGGRTHALYYRDGNYFTNLARLDEDYSNAKSINDHEEVVGSWGKEASGVAVRGGFLYRDGRRTEIQDLLPPDSGWQILTAEGINNAGQIVGAGIFDGQERPYVLSPIRKDRK